MKILTEVPQPEVAKQTAASRADKTDGAPRKRAGSKTLSTGDTVDFTASLDSSLKSAAEQAKRVETIKASIEAGTYQVNSRDIAEKMLTVISHN